MRACFYSPYIPMPTIGGGEKHLFDMTQVVSTRGEVFIAVPRNKYQEAEKRKTDYIEFLGVKEAPWKFLSSPLGTNAPFTEKVLWTRQFDHFFLWTDGSMFFSLAKNNHLHVQIPFTDKKTGLIDRLKLACWHDINTNSFFTKKVIENNWHTNVDKVIYPKVDLNALKTAAKKEKIILNVGRFFRQLHSKRQDVLVEVFKELKDQNKNLLKGWKLVLVGGIEDKDYFAEVKKAARGYEIEFKENLSREELNTLYKKAAIYWHAAGFGINEQTQPQLVEHFGISTAEAMAAGAVPVVVGKGGQVEVLGRELEDLAWQTKEDCFELTLKLLSNASALNKYRQQAEQRAKIFSSDVFSQAVLELIQG